MKRFILLICLASMLGCGGPQRVQPEGSVAKTSPVEKKVDMGYDHALHHNEPDVPKRKLKKLTRDQERVVHRMYLELVRVISDYNHEIANYQALLDKSLPALHKHLANIMRAESVARKKCPRKTFKTLSDHDPRLKECRILWARRLSAIRTSGDQTVQLYEQLSKQEKERVKWFRQILISVFRIKMVTAEHDAGKLEKNIVRDMVKKIKRLQSRLPLPKDMDKYALSAYKAVEALGKMPEHMYLRPGTKDWESRNLDFHTSYIAVQGLTDWGRVGFFSSQAEKMRKARLQAEFDVATFQSDRFDHFVRQSSGRVIEDIKKLSGEIIRNYSGAPRTQRKLPPQTKKPNDILKKLKEMKKRLRRYEEQGPR